jgi:hypothetical protein
MDVGHNLRSRPAAPRASDVSDARTRSGAKAGNKTAIGQKKRRASGSGVTKAGTVSKATASGSRRGLPNFVTNDQNRIMSDDYVVNMTPFNNDGDLPQAKVDAMFRRRSGAKRRASMKQETRVSSR